MNARATSFATLKDLRAYIICLLSGKSATYCYRVGDNGTGSWGANTATLKTAYCALPRSVARKNMAVRVTLKGVGHGMPFTCICGDEGPDGVVDLNPAALVAAGLPSDTELDCPCSWERIPAAAKKRKR